MTCSPIKFGVGNQVEDAALISNLTPLTDINWLKNDWRGRLVKYPVTSDPITTRGELAAQTTATFFAIPGHNLPPGATVKLELFDDLVSTTDLLLMGDIEIYDQVPVGVFEVGVDPAYAEDDSQVSGTFIFWFDAPVTYQAWKLSITHGFTVDPSPPSSGRFLQDAAGLVSMEAESSLAIITNVGSEQWASKADGTASGGDTMEKTGTVFYGDPFAGPRMSYPITASQSGVMDVWILCKPASGHNSVYIIWDGHNATMIYNPVTSNWTWVKVRTITTVAGANHHLVIAARDSGFDLDKIVIQPTGTVAPTSTGPGETTEGEEGSTDSVYLRMLILGTTLQLDNNFNYGGEFRYMTPPEIAITESGYAVGIGDQKPVRTFSLSLAAMSDSDKMRLIYFERALNGRSFIVAPFVGKSEWEDSAHTMLAKFAGDGLKYRHGFDDHHQSEIILIEA